VQWLIDTGIFGAIILHSKIFAHSTGHVGNITETPPERRNGRRSLPVAFARVAPTQAFYQKAAAG
jgi:hypothetical protein